MPATKNQLSIQSSALANLTQSQPQPMLEALTLCEQALEALDRGLPLEEVLNQDNNLLRTFMANTPGLVYVKDIHSRFLLASHSMLHVLGLTDLTELVGKTSFDFFPPDLAQQYLEDEKIVLKTGHPLLNREEFVVSPADSAIRGWYSTSIIPMRNNRGEIIGLIGISHNITRHRQTEEALLESQTRLKLFNSIATKISAGTSADEMIQRTVQQIGDAFTNLRVSYAILNAAGNLIVTHSSQPLGFASLIGVIYNFSDVPELLPLLAQHEPLIVTDIWVHPHLALLHQTFADHHIRAILMVPVFLGDNLVALLGFDSPLAHQWNTHESITLIEISEYLTVALQNIYAQEERQRAETELRASEELFRLVVSSISDHIYVTKVTETGEHINLYLSPHVEVMTGYPMERFLNDWSFWPSTVIHPDDRARASTQAATNAKGEHNQVEYRLVRADGRIIWVRDSARVQTESSSQAKIIYGLVSDITERKQAELEREWLTTELRDINQTLDERVRTRTAELQAILDAVGEGIVVTDLNGVIQYVNPTLAKLTGFHEEETIGQTPRLWRSDKQPPAFYASMWQTIRTGQTWRGELINKRRDGTLYDVMLTITPIHGSHGQPVGFVGVQSDITPFKQMDRLKSEFISMAAHELRTPLTSILGFSEILITRKLTEDRHARYLKFINQQALGLRAILDDLLDLARLEAGEGFEITETLVDLKETAEETLFGFQENNPKHRYQVIGPETWPKIKGDPVKLAQLLKNLVSNATKYSPDGGNITLEAKIEETYSWMHLTLTDQGMGMTPEQVPQVFERFYRADASNTAIGGTGLGMTITRLIVERHGGKIWIESEHQVSTSVHVIFPLLNRPTFVLIIEDDHGLRELQQRVLKAEGFTVLGASEGKTGLELAHTCLPNLILLDLALPGMAGFEVLERLQNDNLTKDIPIVITSAIDTAAEIEQAIVKGASDYLVKPYGMGDLTIRVNRALARSPIRSNPGNKA